MVDIEWWVRLCYNRGMKKKMSKGLIILTAAIALAVVAAAIVLGIMFLSPKSNPQYIAHRGYSQCHPDNTAVSFTAAAKERFAAIETDVRATSDGVPVCSHDPEVKYADGTVLTVASCTFAELKAKPLKNDRSDEVVYICTFAEYLDICREGGKTAIIELKGIMNDDTLAAVLAEVDRHYAREKSVLIGFDWDNLVRLKQMDASLNLQYLSSKLGDPNFDRCIEQGISVAVNYKILTKSLVKKFHNKGLDVNVWTVKSAAVRNRARRLGVDYITSNDVPPEN
jgi:glycerophosphoryl diester phosphodiesterase